MKKLFGSLRRNITPLAAIAIVATLYQLTRIPALSHSESVEMASRFRFTRFHIPELSGYLHKSSRAVNPSLEQISAWISSVGAGLTLADLDGDGLANDVCCVDPRTDSVTVAPIPNTGERYQPFALNSGPVSVDGASVAPMGCIAGDLNEDGLMDLLIYYWGHTPVTFLRRGGDRRAGEPKLGAADFIARDIAPTGERWYTNAATLADLDGDAHVDLIIGNYFQDGARILDVGATTTDEMHDTKAKSFNGGRNRLLLWTGAAAGANPSVQFEDAKEALDEDIARGWTLAVGAADLDGDLLPEIYFANDFGPDRLLYNQSTAGNLRFKLLEGKRGFTTPASFVMGRDSFKGMGVDFADINGDGLFDIFVSNITTPFGLQESNFAWLSTGDIDLMKIGVAPYRQASEELGLSRSGWGWDCRLEDFDNDAAFELLQATGFIRGNVNRWPELQSLGTANSQFMHDPRYWPRFKPGDDLSGDEANAFFVLGKDGKYYNICKELGFDEPLMSRGISIADVDGDGRLDFAIANQWKPPLFYHNDSENVGAFLGLRLLLAPQPSSASARNRPAIGAVATIYLPDGRRLIEQVDGGSGHSGKRCSDIHFGLGHLDNSERLKVEVRWRGLDRRVYKKNLHLPPGWHTIQLQ